MPKDFPFICRVRIYRKEKNITQEELAEKLGVSRQSIISLEHGECLPSLNLAVEIANFFEKTIEETFGMEKLLQNRFDEFEQLSNDNLSSIQLPATAIPETSKITVPVDISQTKKEIHLRADLPGVKEDDLEIEISPNAVDIHGERKEEIEETGKEYFRKESNYGSFARVIPLPAKVKTTGAKAEMHDGTLQIVLQKEAVSKPKTVKIKISKK